MTQPTHRYKLGDAVRLHGYNGTVTKVCDHPGEYYVALPGGTTLGYDSEIEPAFRSELTPEGEQMVIPGCERDEAPGVQQRELF